MSYEPGPNQPLYEPLNYDRKFEGPVTLRHALEDSRNIPAVKAMAEIGPPEVIRYAKQFGFKGDYPPFLSRIAKATCSRRRGRTGTKPSELTRRS